MEAGLKVHRKPLVYRLDLGFLNPSTNQKTQGEEQKKRKSRGEQTNGSRQKKAKENGR